MPGCPFGPGPPGRPVSIRTPGYCRSVAHAASCSESPKVTGSLPDGLTTP